MRGVISCRPFRLAQSENAKLSKLCLGVESFEMTSLATVLCKAKSSKYLDSSGNHLDDENVSTLVAVLPNNKTLKSLCSWNNNITDKGAK